MTEFHDLLAELKRVRDALLSPTVPVLQACEQKLCELIDAVRRSGRQIPSSAEFHELIRSIHSLLESAKAFWDVRWGTIRPNQMYSPSGLLFPMACCSTFVLEL